MERGVFRARAAKGSEVFRARAGSVGCLERGRERGAVGAWERRAPGEAARLPGWPSDGVKQKLPPPLLKGKEVFCLRCLIFGIVLVYDESLYVVFCRRAAIL